MVSLRYKWDHLRSFRSVVTWPNFLVPLTMAVVLTITYVKEIYQAVFSPGFCSLLYSIIKVAATFEFVNEIPVWLFK